MDCNDNGDLMVINALYWITMNHHAWPLPLWSCFARLMMTRFRIFTQRIHVEWTHEYDWDAVILAKLWIPGQSGHPHDQMYPNVKCLELHFWRSTFSILGRSPSFDWHRLTLCRMNVVLYRLQERGLSTTWLGVLSWHEFAPMTFIDFRGMKLLFPDVPSIFHRCSIHSPSILHTFSESRHLAVAVASGAACAQGLPSAATSGTEAPAAERAKHRARRRRWRWGMLRVGCWAHGDFDGIWYRFMGFDTMLSVTPLGDCE